MPSRNAIEIIISAEDDASDKVSGISDVMGDLGKSVAVGAAAIVGATAAIGGGMLALAEDAAPLEGIKNSFDALAKSAGKSGDELLKSMTKASLGMVDDKDLMLQYNKSAQLVGTTLAGQLPDAYKYLAKVAASSGQDLGQMMDTFVNGIGRVTPRMLTQLGVTVDADAANKAYAASIGKNVDQLTKQDKQTALFNATMEQLKKNTAAMPDVTNNAATKWQQFQIKMDDFKDTLGVKLLPFFSMFIDLISKLADAVLPPLSDFLTNILMPAFMNFGQRMLPQIISFIDSTVIPVFQQFLIQLILLWTQIQPGLQQFAQWFTQTALPAVVNFITSVVIPGIQRFIQIIIGIWAQVYPVLQKLAAWFITDVLPVVVHYIQDVVIPAIQKFIEGLSAFWSKVAPALKQFADWFIATVLPQIVAFINNVVIPVVSKIVQIIGDIWTTVAPALGDLAAWFLTDALPAVVDFIDNVVLPVINDVINILKAIWTAVQPALKSFQDGVQGVMQKVQDFIAPVKQFVDDLLAKITDLKNAVSGGVGALGGAAANASTAANLVTSGQVSPQQFLNALGNAIGSQISGHALGIRSVKEDGLYKLHAGETVNTKAESQSTGGSPIAINFYGGNGVNNQADANDAGFMVASALKLNGINLN